MHSTDDQYDHRHSHSVEIITYVESDRAEGEAFDTIEGFTRDYLTYFDQKYLNDLPEFSTVIGTEIGAHTDQSMRTRATIEQLGHVIFEGLQEKLQRHNLILRQLMIGETPLRMYTLSRKGDVK